MLAIRALTKQYAPEDPYALQGLDLNVAAGECIAILGLSGSGKSTLIRCINGLVRPTSGTIRYDGQDITGLSDKEMRRIRKDIGMIFQEFHLIERLSVLENVLVGRFGQTSTLKALLGRFQPDEIQQALNALDRVGLGAFSQRRARDLSGGQKQRVAIARALLQEPRLILCDEPVSSLDPITANSVLSLLAEINRRDGITLLINLHDVQLAKRFASRIIGLAHGRLVFDGEPEDVDDAVLQRIYGAVDEAADEQADHHHPTMQAGSEHQHTHTVRQA